MIPLLFLALAAPALSLNIARPNTSALAQSGSAHDALLSIEKIGVPSGIVYPFQVLAHNGSLHAALARIRADIARDVPAIARLYLTPVSPPGD